MYKLINVCRLLAEWVSSSSLLAWQQTSDCPCQDFPSLLRLWPTRSLLQPSIRILMHHWVRLLPCPKRDALASGKRGRKGQHPWKRRSNGRPIPDACWRDRRRFTPLRCCSHTHVMPPTRTTCRQSSCGVGGPQRLLGAAQLQLEIGSLFIF